MTFRHTLAAALAVALFTGAPAGAAVIDGTEFTNGVSVQTVGGLNWAASGGNFQQKTLGTPSVSVR